LFPGDYFGQLTQGMMMKAHILWNPWTGLYDATLLGGEFANCHGRGSTPEHAMISLKLTVRAKRRLLRNFHMQPIKTLKTEDSIIELHHDNGPHQDGRYRWYDGNGTDTEISGATIQEAIKEAYSSIPELDQFN
jgi:hypothetical protein